MPLLDHAPDNFGPALVARVQLEAPGVRLCFLQKADKDSGPIRDGRVDLETGVIDQATGGEIRTQALFHDRFVGVVRAGHQLGAGEVTAARYAAIGHVCVSRRGLAHDQVDEALASLGLQRHVVTIVGGFATALALARGSDLVATVPEHHTGVLRHGMHSFPVPAPMSEITVHLLWHPRMDADLAHRWLRQCVRETCAHGAPALAR